jgi:hypothetical protein
MFSLGLILSVNWDDRPIRVLMGDEIETFYDVYWPEDIGWGLKKARTASYYRIPTQHLEENSSVLRSEPLTDRETQRHRPDLPLRMLQDSAMNWFEDNAKVASYAGSICLDVKQIAIAPFGAKGARQKAQIFECLDGEQFTGHELLQIANSIQEAVCPAVSGIGMYRDGISLGVPSYYLWGSVDKAGHSR